MPIYEYRCDEGHEVELMQSITEDPITECPECGAPTRRVLHSPAIHFKGSGFHNTDYGTRSRNKARETSEGGSTDSPGNGSGSGSESGKSGEGKAPAKSDSGSSGGDSAKGPAKDA